MESKKLLEIAEKALFSDAAVIGTDQIVFDPRFRPYCEENLCGQYGINYSCPPDCGTPEQMAQRIRNKKRALVLRTVWEIPDLSDSEAIKAAKKKHNDRTFCVIEQMEAQGKNCLMVGSSGCTMCKPCLLGEGKPCAFPKKMYSCMSAYCIYVKDLAEKCSMEYDIKDGKLPLFSMIVFD
jgi:predicted metal-binding protein